MLSWLIGPIVSGFVNLVPIGSMLNFGFLGLTIINTEERQ